MNFQIFSHLNATPSLTHFILLITLLFANGCTRQTVCLDPKVVALRGGFYVRDSVDSTDNYRDSLLMNSNLFFGSGLNYYRNIKSGAKFSLPLSQSQDSVFIIFQADSTNMDVEQFDTIRLSYVRQLHFISTACGYETFFNNLQVYTTRKQIDSVIVSAGDVNNDVNQEHLKIVLKN